MLRFAASRLTRVQAGDTLATVADRLGVEAAALQADGRSGVPTDGHLVIGQEVLAPASVPAFRWPAAGPIVEGFGACRLADCTTWHRGVDLAEAPGTPVRAVAAGTVRFAGGQPCCGLGYQIWLDHGDGWVSILGHFLGPAVRGPGETVAPGDLVGLAGSSGDSSGPHVHLGLAYQGWDVDPLRYLP